MSATGSSVEPVADMKGMLSCCLIIEVLPYPLTDIAEGFFTNYSSVVISKTSDTGIQFAFDLLLSASFHL